MTINIKDIVSARFQNPKFQYDGKRMRNLAVRKALDYSKYVLPLSLDVPHTTIFHRHAEHVSINKMRCPINIVRFTPDGRRLISGTSTGEFTLWNSFSFNFETILQAHESPVRGLEFTRLGDLLLSADTTGTVKFWHLSMNNVGIRQCHEEAIRDMSVADNYFVTASDDSTVRVHNFEKNECMILRGHNWDVRVAQYNPRSSLVASGGKDNLVKLWDTRTKRCVATMHCHKNTVLCARWIDDMNLLTAGKDQVIKQSELRMLKDNFTYKCKKEVTALCVMNRCMDSSGIRSAKSANFSCNSEMRGDLFAAGMADGSIAHLQVFNQNMSVVSGHESTVWSIDYHPIGHLMASGSMDQSVRFWSWRKKEMSEEVETNEERIPGLCY